MIVNHTLRISLRMDFQTNNKGDIIKYRIVPVKTEMVE
jgi:hypothetical protein